jgi:glycosyltransferase involved in cell wall biosynthesis
MKILHVANFSWFNNASVYYAIDRKISNGLIRNGHFVYDFSYRDIARHLSWLKRKKLGKKAMNEALLKTIQMLEPELILFGHSELVSVKTIQQIKRDYPHIKMGLWWVDWLENVKTIIGRLPYLDVVFTTTGVSESNKVLLSNKTIIAYIPNMCDRSIDSYTAFKAKTVYDIFYAGRFDIERQDIVNNFEKLSKKYNIGLFGLHQDSILLGSKFIETIGKSKCAINYSRNNAIPLYSSDRIIQLVANGSLVFTPKIPQFEKIFTENEVVYFDNIEDLNSKIDMYLSNEEMRVKIAEAGYKRAHDVYNSTVVTKFMLEVIFDLPYSQEYGWEDETDR